MIKEAFAKAFGFTSIAKRKPSMRINCVMGKAKHERELQLRQDIIALQAKYAQDNVTIAAYDQCSQMIWVTGPGDCDYKI